MYIGLTELCQKGAADQLGPKHLNKTNLQMGVSENSGFSPQIIHFNRVFHYFHHPFWGTTIFGNTQIDIPSILNHAQYMRQDSRKSVGNL